MAYPAGVVTRTSGRLRTLPGVVNELGHALGQDGAMPHPVIDALVIEAQTRLGKSLALAWKMSSCAARSAGKKCITRAAAVGDRDLVERTFLGART